MKKTYSTVKNIQRAVDDLRQWVIDEECPAWARSLVSHMADLIEDILINREV